MILSNIEIFRALDEKRLIIKPEPTPRLPSLGTHHCPFDTHSVDLRLGNEITVPEKGQIIYDVTKPGNIANTIQKHSKTIQISEEHPYPLEPNKFILGKTLEYIDLPLPEPIGSDADRDTVCLAARIEGKSSRARSGILIHFTAPTVHPGFDGTLTLEMINLGAADFILRPGMYIAQLIIEEVRGRPADNPSEFKGQAIAAGNVTN